MNRDLSEIRKDFTKNALDESQLNKNPILQFKEWLQQAIDLKEPEPTAMTLSTVSSEGVPSSRIVLLKNINKETGFRFFTNYNSKKGRELDINHFAALNFFWANLERQVRITGRVNKIKKEESDKYFYSRPEDSQISAIASPQSQVVENRKFLQNLFESVKSQSLSRPANWGGYDLSPYEIEFWQGRSGRLHDRIRYKLENKNWIRERLAP